MRLVKKLITLFFALLYVVISFAQSSAVKYSKGHFLDSMYFDIWRNNDETQRVCDILEKKSVSENDNEYAAFAQLMKDIVQLWNTKNQAVFNKIISDSEKEYASYANTQARAYCTIANYYFFISHNYQQAFVFYFKLRNLLTKYDGSVVTDYANHMVFINDAYYKFKDYRQSIEISLEALPFTTNKWPFYNTVGLCYEKLNMNDSAIFYFNKAIEETHKANNVDNLGVQEQKRKISYGNIGQIYHGEKKYAQAKPLISDDLKWATKHDDYPLMVGAAIPLADIYLEEKKMDSAKALIDKARELIQLYCNNEKLDLLFPVVTKYYMLTGDNAKASAYKDSTIKAIRYTDSVYNNLMLMRVQQRNDSELLSQERNQFELYKKLTQTRTIGFAAAFAFIGIIIFILGRYRRKAQRDKKQIEELNKILELRQTLSADMHDDLGSMLSSISIYTHSLLMQPQLEENRKVLDKIRTNAQAMQDNMSDIIWNINPVMDSMSEVLSRMCSFGADITDSAGINFEFVEDERLKSLSLDMAVRKNTYLIFKEAINNAVKYSDCKNIVVSVSVHTVNFMQMIIKDDGVGFDIENANRGNGLLNMKKRAAEMGGALDIKTEPNSGTIITLYAKI